jgi:hypothetical protein
MSVRKFCVAIAPFFALLLLAAFPGGCVRVGSTTIISGQTSSGNEIALRDLQADGANPMHVSGTWEGRVDQPNNNFLQVQLDRVTDGGGRSSVSYSVAGGAARPLIRGDDGPVDVKIQRDAGTLVLHGSVTKGRGAGTADFTADPAYVNEVSVQTGETVTAERALELALVDLPLDFVKKVEEAGYKASTADLISLRFAGVSAAYAVDFRKAGYSFSCGELRTLKFAGVEPSWAKGFEDAGYKFGADDLRSLRFAGVTPDYAAGFRRAGYDLSVDQLRSLRFAGVPADFAAELGEAGYHFTPEELRSLRFAGVPASYAAELKKAGYNFSADELRRLRFSGVPADYATAAAAPGKEHLSADDLIRLRFRGVDTATMRKLRE